MGWGRMLLLGNWGQQMDIEDQREELERLRQNMASSIRGGVDAPHLRKDLDETRLYTVALMRLLVTKGVLSNDEVRAMVDAIDREDGKADGRASGPTSKID